MESAYGMNPGGAWTFFVYLGKIEIKFLPRHFRQTRIILPRQFRQNRIILQLSKQNAKFVDIITQLFLDKPNE